MPTINSFRLSVLLVVVVFCLYNRRTEPERGSVRLRRAAVQNWPPVGNYPLPLLDEWTSLVDRTAIPQLNVRKTADEPCASGDPGCTWSCNLCIGPEDVSDCPDKNTIAITFDDGPTQFTPSLLDFLDKNNIKVTFFIIGSQLINDANKATLLRAFQAGHQIASHTWSHRALTTLNNEEVIAEVMWTHEIITSVIGVSPAFIRPPYGDIDDRVRSIIKQLGYRAVIWNYDTNDWKLPSDSTMKISDIADDFQKWISDSTRSKGIIPLEHDLYAQSVQAFEEAFPTIQASNIKLMKVAECLGANPYMGSVINGTVTSKPSTSAGTTTSVPSPASKPSTSSKVGSSSTPVSGKTGSATRETLSMGYFFAAAICCILAAF